MNRFWNKDMDPLELFSPSEIYHENSKINFEDINYSMWIYHINSSHQIHQLISKPFDHYLGYPRVMLPREFEPTQQSFEDILVSRRSMRYFSAESISLKSIAKILYLSGGITASQTDREGITWFLRPCPSGGGLYPIDLYLVALRVEDIPKGLYFYFPKDHCLEQVYTEDLAEKLKQATYLHETIEQAAAVIVLCARFLRIKFKYAERAYRFVLLEAGHIAQNILLTSQAEGLGSLVVGGFADDILNEILRVDGVRDAVVYMVVIGKPLHTNSG